MDQAQALASIREGQGFLKGDQPALASEAINDVLEAIFHGNLNPREQLGVFRELLANTDFEQKKIQGCRSLFRIGRDAIAAGDTRLAREALSIVVCETKMPSNPHYTAMIERFQERARSFADESGVALTDFTRASGPMPTSSGLRGKLVTGKLKGKLVAKPPEPETQAAGRLKTPTRAPREVIPDIDRHAGPTGPGV